MSKDEWKADYDVGYKKPPKSGQFQKGKSGNPNGRPPGAKGFDASLKRELESLITIREGSRAVKISKAEAAAKRLVDSALKGNMTALKMLAKFDGDLAETLRATASAADAAQTPEPVDYEILRNFFGQEASAEAKADADHEADVDDTIDDWEIDDDGS